MTKKSLPASMRWLIGSSSFAHMKILLGNSVARRRKSRPGILPDRSIRMLLVQRLCPNRKDYKGSWVVVDLHPAGTIAPAAGWPGILPERAVGVQFVQ